MKLLYAGRSANTRARAPIAIWTLLDSRSAIGIRFFGRLYVWKWR